MAAPGLPCLAFEGEQARRGSAFVVASLRVVIQLGQAVAPMDLQSGIAVARERLLFRLVESAFEGAPAGTREQVFPGGALQRGERRQDEFGLLGALVLRQQGSSLVGLAEAQVRDHHVPQIFTALRGLLTQHRLGVSGQLRQLFAAMDFELRRQRGRGRGEYNGAREHSGEQGEHVSSGLCRCTSGRFSWGSNRVCR
jgi:hypothetical protein